MDTETLPIQHYLKLASLLFLLAPIAFSGAPLLGTDIGLREITFSPSNSEILIMWDKLIHIIPTLLDLLALTTCIGALGCRLWVLPPDMKSMNALDSEALLTRLWQLLAVCIMLLILSSTLLLATRAAEMSSLSVVGILPVFT